MQRDGVSLFRGCSYHNSYLISQYLYSSKKKLQHPVILQHVKGLGVVTLFLKKYFKKLNKTQKKTALYRSFREVTRENCRF